MQERPRLHIEWHPKTVKHRAKPKDSRDQDWTWTFWRTTVLGTDFQFGRMTTDLWDFTPRAERTPPQDKSARWELWCTFEKRAGPEFMAILFCNTADEARIEAEERINQYFEERRRLAQQEL